MLKGWKTYICAIGLAAVTIGRTLGLVDDQMAAVLNGFLGAGGLAALRNAVR